MTLFKKADEKDKCHGIFKEVIDTFYQGKEDKITLSILKKQEEEKEKINKIGNETKNKNDNKIIEVNDIEMKEDNNDNNKNDVNDVDMKEDNNDNNKNEGNKNDKKMVAKEDKDNKKGNKVDEDKKDIEKNTNEMIIEESPEDNRDIQKKNKISNNKINPNKNNTIINSIGIKENNEDPKDNKKIPNNNNKYKQKKITDYFLLQKKRKNEDKINKYNNYLF